MGKIAGEDRKIMENGLSEKQNNVLKYLQKYINEKNTSPSTREMAKDLGISSWVAHYYMGKLEELKVIKVQRKTKSIGKIELLKIAV